LQVWLDKNDENLIKKCMLSAAFGFIYKVWLYNLILKGIASSLKSYLMGNIAN